MEIEFFFLVKSHIFHMPIFMPKIRIKRNAINFYSISYAQI